MTQTDTSELRLVLAYVQPFMAAAVLDVLHRTRGVSGVTVVEAHGFGRGRRAGGASAELVAGTTDRTRIETVVPESATADVVAAIVSAAHTGQRGDGKVYVMPVLNGIRIATGREDER